MKFSLNARWEQTDLNRKTTDDVGDVVALCVEHDFAGQAPDLERAIEQIKLNITMSVVWHRHHGKTLDLGDPPPAEELAELPGTHSFEFDTDEYEEKYGDLMIHARK